MEVHTISKITSGSSKNKVSYVYWIFMIIVCIHSFNHHNWVRHWWLTPVILAIQETEIRRIEVRSQPRQIVWETLSWKYLTQRKGWWSGLRCRPWVEAPVLQKKIKLIKKNHHNSVRIIILISQRKKMRQREVETLAQGHIACKWCVQALLPGGQTPKFLLIAIRLSLVLPA
jgi:hypothetical protein